MITFQGARLMTSTHISILSLEKWVINIWIRTQNCDIKNNDRNYQNHLNVKSYMIIYNYTNLRDAQSNDVQEVKNLNFIQQFYLTCTQILILTSKVFYHSHAKIGRLCLCNLFLNKCFRRMLLADLLNY